MDNCRQNINRDVSNNQNPFSTDDKSQNPIKDSNGVNSISVAVNTETISQETLNVSEVVVSTLPNTHCVKSVEIRSFSSPYFPVFSPNTGKYRREKLHIGTLFAQ